MILTVPAATVDNYCVYFTQALSSEFGFRIANTDWTEQWYSDYLDFIFRIRKGVLGLSEQNLYININLLVIHRVRPGMKMKFGSKLGI